MESQLSTFDNVLDINELQIFQDSFSKTFDIPCIIHNSKGEFKTKQSDDSQLFSLINSSAKGKNKCITLFKSLIPKLIENNETIIIENFLLKKLTIAIHPIIINNQLIAGICIGYIADHPIDETEIKKLANELELDELKLITKIVEIIPIKQEKVERTLEFFKSTIITATQTSIQQKQLQFEKQINNLNELVTEHENYKAVFENRNIAYIIVDKEFNIIGFNTISQTIVRLIFGKEIQKKQKILEYIAPSEKDFFIESFQKTLKGEPIYIEKKYQDQTGQYDYYLFDLLPIKNHMNEITKVCIIAIDITKLKIAEKASRKNYELFQLIADNSNDAIWITDNDFNFIYLSQSIEKLVGYTIEERKQISLEQIYSTENVQLIKDLAERQKNLFYKTGINQSQIFEVNAKHKDGSKLFLEISAKLVIHDGKVTGYQGSTRDTTERKLTELAHKFILDLYKNTEKTSTEKILNLSLEKVIELTQSNIGYFHLVDTDKETITLQLFKDNNQNKCILEIPNKTYSMKNAGIWFDCVRNKKAIIHNNYKELTEKKGIPHGHVKIYKHASIPVFHNEKIVAIIGVGNKTNNYTEFDINLITNLISNVWNFIRMKNAEISTLKLQKAVEHSKACIVITDYEGNIEYANPFFTESTGYLPEEYLGKNPNILKTNYHPIDYYQKLWNTIKSGKTWEGQFQNKKKNGDLYWENVVISPIIGLDNQITHFVGIKTDITENKRIAKELLDAKEKIEESDQLKSAFLKNISHEVRTPMNAIVGFSELIIKPEIPTERKAQFNDIIKNSVHQLLNIIENTITISSIETNQLIINKIEFNPNKIISDLYDEYLEFRKKNQKTNINLVPCFIANRDLKITTDYTRLNQIMHILLDNAFKFTTTGSIEFGAITEDISQEPTIRFFVKDTGIGIPKDKQNIVFKKFAHATETVTQYFGGIGLGLSITAGLVKLLNGELIVNSEENKGTEIIICLHQNYNENQNFIKKEQTDVKQKSEIVMLVAEDEFFNYQYIEAIFTDSKIKLLHAANGKAAIEIFNNQTIDLILMDLKMPEMDGFEATAEIRKTNKEIPIIAQTAFAFKREICYNAEFTDYITKPFTEEELFAVLKPYCQNLLP